MKVLVACEESQAVTKEMRKNGHEAYSCDIVDQSGGHPEWHIMQDAIPLLNGNCEFKTCDGVTHRIDGKWDIIIAHGQRWLYWGDEEYRAKKKKDQEEAIEFFMKFANADCDKIAIENPTDLLLPLPGLVRCR